MLREGPPDFAAVLQRAGVTAEQTLRVKKAQELLKQLPSGATPALKRQIVEVAFKAFDVPTAEIIIAATVTIVAVENFVAAGEAVQRRAVDEGTARIQDLERQITEVRAEIDKAVAAQEGRAAAAREEIARIRPILTFFESEADEPSADPRDDTEEAESAELPIPFVDSSPQAITS